ncbi:MAG: hypothetical protein SRB1_01231 [Desulfobacteraceae bacterium Eth-SRB1]|nr:MAG: hypothetical protein SRB1_01231 [Desulfobacteraceae bacterium Eth-SRB1]
MAVKLDTGEVSQNIRMPRVGLQGGQQDAGCFVPLPLVDPFTRRSQKGIGPSGLMRLVRLIAQDEPILFAGYAPDCWVKIVSILFRFVMTFCRFPLILCSSPYQWTKGKREITTSTKKMIRTRFLRAGKVK